MKKKRTPSQDLAAHLAGHVKGKRGQAARNHRRVAADRAADVRDSKRAKRGRS